MTGEMLDQYAGKTLQRAENGAMDHHRTMIGAVGAAILQIEAFG